MSLGRTDEGMRQIELALALDPLNDYVRIFFAGGLLYARRYDEALARAREFLRAQPGSLAGLGLFVSAAIMKQQWADAVAANAAVYEGIGRPDVAEALKKGYAEAGYAAAFRRAADVELAKHGNEGGAKYDAAGNYAVAGDYPRALDWLEKAYDDRDPNMPYIGCMPFFDPLRAEPRFQALLRKMNLPH
jgi:tetratricopeptide (TPR) repeat protein